MGITFRQSVKSSLVIFTGAVLGVLVIFLSTEYIPKSEFGFLRYFSSQAIIASQFTMMGMSSVMLLFILRYEADDPRKPVLITISLLIPVLLTILFSVFYFAFKINILNIYDIEEDRMLLDEFYIWFPVFVLIFSLLTLLEQYLNSQLKVALSLFMREVVLRILNIILILLFGFGYVSFTFLMIGTILIHLIPLFLLVFFAQKTEGFHISLQWKKLSRQEYKDVLHFGWYHMLMSISIYFLVYLDTLMLGPLDKTGMSAVAEYTVAAYGISFLQIPYRAMSASAIPQITVAYEKNKMDEVHDLFKRSSLNALIASLGMGLVIFFNMNSAVSILTEGYGSIKLIVLILMVGRLVDMGTGLNNELISISKYYKFNFYVSILLVVMMIIFNLILIPPFGVYGAAWGTSIALIVFNGIKLVFLWNKFHLQPFSFRTIRVLVCALLAGIAGAFMPAVPHPFLDIALRSLLMLGIYTPALYYSKSSPDLNHYIMSVWRNKRLY